MSDYQIVGPFESHRVVVDGHRVPFLDAMPVNGGKIGLLLDGRYALDISVADADAFIPWIADAIAIAMGYTCHPRAGKEPVRASPFPADHAIDWIRTDADLRARRQVVQVVVPVLVRVRAERVKTAGAVVLGYGRFRPR